MNNFEPIIYKNYEMFIDASYYHMWAVRKKGCTLFEESLHTTNKEAAIALIDVLTRTESNEDNSNR